MIGARAVAAAVAAVMGVGAVPVVPLSLMSPMSSASAQPAVRRVRVAVVVDLLASVSAERASAIGQALAEALAIIGIALAFVL